MEDWKGKEGIIQEKEPYKKRTGVCFMGCSGIGVLLSYI